MLRYLFSKKICEQKIYTGQSRLPLYYVNRFLNLQIIISILLFLFVVYILRLWGSRISFGQYSYVVGRETILEIRSSRYHNLTVAQSGSLRMLRSDTLTMKGIVHLENPHTILLDYMRLQLLCLLWNPEPERILIIGLGVSILPRVFHYLTPNTLIDIVEIDSAIVELARKHFYFKDTNFLRVIIEDGRHFIERQASNKYDVIIIDVFTVNGHVPHVLRTLECLGEYLRILKSTGLVVGNFLYEQESRYRQTYARALFQHIYRGITKDNYILIGLHKQAKIFNQNELQLRARVLQQSKRLPDLNWTEIITNIQNGNDDKWNISATIFTDQYSEDLLDLSKRN